MQEKNKKLWFRRKRYGWGWYPISWEGWLVICVYVGLLVKTFLKIDAHSHSNSDTLIGFAVPWIIATLILIFICYKKGEAPHWQWGRENKQD